MTGATREGRGMEEGGAGRLAPGSVAGGPPRPRGAHEIVLDSVLTLRLLLQFSLLRITKV